MQNKFLHLLGVCMIGLLAFSMQAQDTQDQINLLLDVDNASRIIISLNGEELETIQDGPNNLTVDPWTNLSITAADGCKLVSVVDGEGEAMYIESNSFTKFIGDDITELSYKITTAEEGLVNFVIEVDNPSKVIVSDAGYNAVSLEKGENKLSMAESSFPLMIGVAKYGEELYSVTLDGETVANNYGYQVTPFENSVIMITADFPDKDCLLSFTEAEGVGRFFTVVSVNDEEFFEYSDGLTVGCGDKVKLYYNQYCWQTADEGNPIIVTINGDETKWFGPGYSFVVRDNTTVNVEQAVPTEKITVTIDIDNPRNVVVYSCSQMFKDAFNLKPGENKVELPKENATIVITAVENEDMECKIDGVSVNGRPKNVEYSNYMELYDLDPDDVIKIYTKGYEESGVKLLPDFNVNAETLFDIFTVTGIKVRGQASPQDLNNLPKGMYIIKGKKIVL